MKHIYKIILSCAVALMVYFYSAQSAVQDGNSSQQFIVTLIAFLVTTFILFFHFLIKPDKERFFYTATGAFLGILAGGSLVSFLSTLGVNIDIAGVPAFLISVVFFGYTGSQLAHSTNFRIFNLDTFSEDPEQRIHEKILDTSVIIDGRILDIAETHFIEGPFIIPNFVLREIQLISDSPDPIKRNRGRRGLEMLNKLQQHGSVKVKISYVDYTDTREVDAKLVKLARETGGKLVTNDFNLNKVAELQGVDVLNLNNLTNALKPVVLPGEDIFIDVIKEGKDENQGIGYLEDGTMVVIENGGTLLGKTVKVNVTSIIQTAAGKMIFTRAVGDDETSSSGDYEEPRDFSGGRGKSGGGRRGGGRGGNRQREGEVREEAGSGRGGSRRN